MFRKNTRLWLWWLAILLTVSLILGGCGGDTAAPADEGVDDAGANAEVDEPSEAEEPSGEEPEEVIELTIWHQENTPDAVPVFEAMVEEFNAQHPNIHVTVQANDWAEAYEKFSAALATGRAPEMVYTIPDYTISLRQTGSVYPVDDLFADLDEEHSFFDAMVSPYEYDDHVWAVPAFGMAHGLWYRKDQFEEAGLDVPQDWDDLMTAAETLTTDERYGIGLGASRHLWTSQNLYDLMVTNAAEDLFDEEGNVDFNDPETVETLALYKELWECCSPPDSTGWGFAEPVPNFNNGSIAMMLHMGHIINFWEEGSGLGPEMLGYAPIPWPEDGRRGSIAYSNGIMLTTEDPAKLEAIRTFLEWLYQPENNGEFLANLTAGLFLPVTEDAAQSDAFWNNETVARYEDIVNAVIENVQHGELYGFTGGTPNDNIGTISGQQILAQVVQKLVVDGMSPEEAAEWGQEQMEAAVAP